MVLFLNAVSLMFQNTCLPENKKIIKVLDLLGRETTIKPNTTLIYMYSDGTSERRAYDYRIIDFSTNYVFV